PYTTLFRSDRASTHAARKLKGESPRASRQSFSARSGSLFAASASLASESSGHATSASAATAETPAAAPQIRRDGAAAGRWIAPPSEIITAKSIPAEVARRSKSTSEWTASAHAAAIAAAGRKRSGPGSRCELFQL